MHDGWEWAMAVLLSAMLAREAYLGIQRWRERRHKKFLTDIEYIRYITRLRGDR